MAFPPIDPTTLSAAIAVLVVFLVLYLTFAGFSMVGITPAEVLVLLFLAPFLGWLNIPLFTFDGLLVGVNGAGFLIPVLLSIRFLVTGRLPWWKGIVGIGVVTGVAYALAVVEPDTGVLVPALPIAGTALLVGVLLAGRASKEVGPVTYASGALGTVIGADVLNLAAIARSVPDGQAAVLGGAGTLDAIYLVALVAVLGAIVAVATTKVLGGSNEG